MPACSTGMPRGLLQHLCDKGRLDRALDVLSLLETPPSTHTYLSLLKACTNSKALAQAKQVHAHLAHHRIQLTGLLGDYLVVTLAKCGAIQDALLTSITLPARTVFSWTAIISAYAERGCGQEALRMHQCMQEDGIQPDHYTLVSLFKACGSILDLEHGKKLHADACRRGFASHTHVSSTLVSMYGKCGAILEAEHVFGALLHRDIVSWSAMLSAYIEQDHAEKALQLYTRVLEECSRPDQLISVLALQACTTLVEKEEGLLVDRLFTNVMLLEIGQALHADAHRNGFALDFFLGSTLVSMYGKCGAIMEAEHVFGAVSHRDVVLWTAMLSAYVKKGEGQKALQLYAQMHKEGVSPDQLTSVLAFQACATIAEKEESLLAEGQVMPLDIGHALHGDVCKKGFTLDIFVGSTLVSMYGKCGAIVEAEYVFCALSQRTVVSWNVMLSACVEQGQAQKALQLYLQLQEEGLSPDQATSLFALQACAILAEKDEAYFMERRSTKVVSFEIGQALHAKACRVGFTFDVFVGSTLVWMYGKCGAILEAEQVFSALCQRTVVSWNAMISAYVEQGKGRKALQLYTWMQQEGVSPDQRTSLFALQACATLAEKEEAHLVEGRSIKVMPLNIGKALHNEAQRKGFASDVFISSTLVSMYSKCGAIVEAEDVFGALSQQHTTVLWTAMLSAYVEQGQGDKALQLYRNMREKPVALDHVTLVCSLQACSATGSLEACKQLHFDIAFAGYDRIPYVAATLLHAYGSCASMVDAQVLFDKLSEPDIVSWNACIAGHAEEGNSLASLHMFEKLKLAGVKPDNVTFMSVLSACSHTGFVIKGLEYFESMSREYGLTPDLKHYSSMLDLFGRAGDFKEAGEMLGRMPMQADHAVWMCLLNACRTYGNLKLAKQVFDIAVKLQLKQATACFDAWYVPAAEMENSGCTEECWPELDST